MANRYTLNQLECGGGGVRTSDNTFLYVYSCFHSFIYMIIFVYLSIYDMPGPLIWSSIDCLFLPFIPYEYKYVISKVHVISFWWIRFNHELLLLSSSYLFIYSLTIHSIIYHDVPIHVFISHSLILHSLLNYLKMHSFMYSFMLLFI